MDQLINESLNNFNVSHPLMLVQLIVTLLLTTLLTLSLAGVYIRTHSGLSYSKSLVHTIVFLGVTISLIMMIIGSNIARAFALVGALSIIRFRNPIKDPRDVAFLFSAIAIGMACGTKFYMFSTIFTLFMICLVMIFHVLQFGEVSTIVHVLKVRMKASARDTVDCVCREMCKRYSVIAIDRNANMDDVIEVMYEIILKKRASYNEFMKRLTDISTDISVNLLVGEGNVNV